MGRPKKPKFEYIPSTGRYRKRIMDSDGKYIAIYGKTEKELEEKVKKAQATIAEISYHKLNPTVEEYANKWLKYKAGYVRYTTLVDYTSVIKCNIINMIGFKYLDEVTFDDIEEMLLNATKKSQSVFNKTRLLANMIFADAVKKHFIDENPVTDATRGGGKDPKDKPVLTNEQAETLLKAVEGHRAQTFVAICIFAGLRREEVLALKWDCVDIESETPVIKVRRTWHIESNRPVVIDKTKTRAGKRIIPIPSILVDILKKSKKAYPSEYVVPNLKGGPLSGTQWTRLWKYVTTRTTKERYYYMRNSDGTKTKHVVIPKLGEKAKHNATCIYTINFDVTAHTLRRTYATNLVYAGVDIKTIQYLLGHKKAETTLDIYAQVKYNRPEYILPPIEEFFSKNIKIEDIIR